MNKSRLFASATAIGAVGLGFLTVPAPAQATPMPPLAPACDAFGFNGPTRLQQSDWSVSFTSHGPRAGGPAEALIAQFDAYDSELIVLNGTVSGGIQGRNVDLTISWSNGSKGRYTGVVDDDWYIVGGTVDETKPSAKDTFRSTAPIACNKYPPPPPPERAPNTVVEAPPIAPQKPPNTVVEAPPIAPQKPAPAPEAPAPPPPAQPKQGPTVTAKPGLTGVTFHITDRSGVASQCTYSSEGFESSFGLPANGSFDLFVPAIRQFRNRTGTVACDNGTSTNTSVFY